MSQSQPDKSLKRSIFARILGRCATKQPADEECWSFDSGRVTVDLTCTPELSHPGSGIRLEGKGVPNRVLVVNGDDGAYHAFLNKCMHAGRRLDPVPGAHTVQCCSVGKATYSYTGDVLRGNVKGPVKIYPVARDGDRLVIEIE